MLSSEPLLRLFVLCRHDIELPITLTHLLMIAPMRLIADDIYIDDY